jgi:hypothetical protein
MDQGLRNLLWNIIYEKFLFRSDLSFMPPDSPFLNSLIVRSIWIYFFREAIDELPEQDASKITQIKSKFYKCAWYEPYDLIEFLVQYHQEEDEDLAEGIINNINIVLAIELSAFRLVNGLITPITSTEEISEIEEASNTPYKSVNIHLQTALKLFSDKKTPDYRNSIKESISSVESLCRSILQDYKATLGQSLKRLEDKGIEIHQSLKGGFEKIYGYTSDEGGIRHGLLDEPDISSEDAKFMLVGCSAFINYLIAKAIKAGIELH